MSKIKQAILRAIVDCPHEINGGSVTLRYDPRGDGHNALSQFSNRLEAALSSAAVAEREPVAFVSAMAIRHHIDSGTSQTGTVLHREQGELYGEKHLAIYLDPPPASELEAEIARLKACLAEVEKALDGLLEPFEGDDCRYDHHGYCQAHFLQEGDECCVKIARHVREGGKAK